jgi:predicted adenine nucleotide alpha hydrolase (AANH) superfamily ATPase
MKLLLHSCCAPCSAAIVEYLLYKDIRPIIFFYNPNIDPEEEYLKRKFELERFARSEGLQTIDGDYRHDLWLAAVAGMESEPERGRRCLACFRHRLTEAARVAVENSCDTLATTLASSRWKNLNQIAEAGRDAVEPFVGLSFWDRNWRKGGLSERRRILLNERGFYNQTWCGCEFSRQLPHKKP